MPKIDPTISVGNLMSIASILAAALLAWGNLDARTKTLERDLLSIREDVQVTTSRREGQLTAFDVRVRTLETSDARSNARLGNIEALLTRIDGRLERIEQRP